MTTEIKPGDDVKHSNPSYTKMTVKTINGTGTMAFCDYFNDELINKQDWFPISDLTKVIYG